VCTLLFSFDHTFSILDFHLGERRSPWQSIAVMLDEWNRDKWLVDRTVAADR